MQWLNKIDDVLDNIAGSGGGGGKQQQQPPEEEEEAQGPQSSTGGGMGGTVAAPTTREAAADDDDAKNASTNTNTETARSEEDDLLDQARGIGSGDMRPPSSAEKQRRRRTSSAAVPSPRSYPGAASVSARQQRQQRPTGGGSRTPGRIRPRPVTTPKRGDEHEEDNVESPEEGDDDHARNGNNGGARTPAAVPSTGTTPNNNNNNKERNVATAATTKTKTTTTPGRVRRPRTRYSDDDDDEDTGDIDAADADAAPTSVSVVTYQLAGAATEESSNSGAKSKTLPSSPDDPPAASAQQRQQTPPSKPAAAAATATTPPPTTTTTTTNNTIDEPNPATKSNGGSTPGSRRTATPGRLRPKRQFFPSEEEEDEEGGEKEGGAGGLDTTSSDDANSDDDGIMGRYYNRNSANRQSPQRIVGRPVPGRASPTRPGRRQKAKARPGAAVPLNKKKKKMAEPIDIGMDKNNVGRPALARKRPGTGLAGTASTPTYPSAPLPEEPDPLFVHHRRVRHHDHHHHQQHLRHQQPLQQQPPTQPHLDAAAKRVVATPERRQVETPGASDSGAARSRLSTPNRSLLDDESTTEMEEEFDVVDLLEPPSAVPPPQSRSPAAASEDDDESAGSADRVQRPSPKKTASFDFGPPQLIDQSSDEDEPRGLARADSMSASVDRSLPQVVEVHSEFDTGGDLVPYWKPIRKSTSFLVDNEHLTPGSLGEEFTARMNCYGVFHVRVLKGQRLPCKSGSTVQAVVSLQPWPGQVRSPESRSFLGDGDAEEHHGVCVRWDEEESTLAMLHPYSGEETPVPSIHVELVSKAAFGMFYYAICSLTVSCKELMASPDRSRRQWFAADPIKDKKEDETTDTQNVPLVELEAVFEPAKSKLDEDETMYHSDDGDGDEDEDLVLTEFKPERNLQQKDPISKRSKEVSDDYQLFPEETRHRDAPVEEIEVSSRSSVDPLMVDDLTMPSPRPSSFREDRSRTGSISQQSNFRSDGEMGKRVSSKPHLLRVTSYWTPASCCVCKKSIMTGPLSWRKAYRCEVCKVDCCADCRLQVDIQLPCSSEGAERAREQAVQNKLTVSNIMNVVAPVDESPAFGDEPESPSPKAQFTGLKRQSTRLSVASNVDQEGEPRGIGRMKFEFVRAMVYLNPVHADEAAPDKKSAMVRKGDYYARVSWTGSTGSKRTRTMLNTGRPRFDSGILEFVV